MNCEAHEFFLQVYIWKKISWLYKLYHSNVCSKFQWIDNYHGVIVLYTLNIAEFFSFSFFQSTLFHFLNEESWYQISGQSWIMQSFENLNYSYCSDNCRLSEAQHMPLAPTLLWKDVQPQQCGASTATKQLIHSHVFHLQEIFR